MKNIIKNSFVPLIICMIAMVAMISSCAKDDYYQDGGKTVAKFDGTVLQYLQSDPKFDTIAQIVKLAGMEDVFSNEDITFFAPTDEVIRRTIGQVNSIIPETRNKLNQSLFTSNKDTIKVLSDVAGPIWRKYLMRYMMKGKFVLKDFPQLDPDLTQLFPGGFYYGYNGDLANVGVVFNTANNVKYTGYRQLSFSFCPDPSNPNFKYSAAVASSDIQPSNGVVHTLAVHIGRNRIGDTRIDEESNTFGIGYDIYSEVILSK